MKKKFRTFILAVIAIFGLIAFITGCKSTQQQESLYTVRYTGGDGATGNAPAACELAEGDRLTLVENAFFQRADHEFVGWKLGEKVYAVGDVFEVPSSDVTFEACWAELYTLTYSFGEESHAAESATLPVAKKMKSGTSVTLPYVEAEEGYSFTGWVASGEDEIRIAGTQYTLTENVTLSAKWNALGWVRYEPDGGTGGDPVARSYRAGELVPLSDNPYSKMGYRFAGWSVTADRNPVTVIEENGVLCFAMPQADVTVKALWKKEYRISYTFGEGESNHGIGDAPVDSAPYVAGEIVSLSSQTILAAVGWEHGGWQVTSASGNPVGVTEGTFTMPENDVLVSAKWTLIPFTVIYARDEHAAADENVRETVTVQSNGGKFVFKDASVFDGQTGLTFCGWRIGDTDYAAGFEVDFKQLIPETGTVITITAQWSARFYAEYSFGDDAHATGEVPVDPADYAVGDIVNLYAETIPAEKGWRFGGWEVRRKGDGILIPLTAEDGGQFRMPEGGALIMAIWTEIGYKIVYLHGEHAGESTVTEENVKISDNGGIYMLRAAYAAEDGYRFTGWSLGERIYEAEERVPFDGLIPEEGDKIVFTAQWKYLVKVTFNPDGGSWDQADSPLYVIDVTEGTVIDFADYDDPKRDGYIFKGWEIEGGEGTVFRKDTPNSTYTVTESISFRALWVKAVAVKFYENLGSLNTNMPPVKTVIVEDGSYLGDVFPDLGFSLYWCLAIKTEYGYDVGQEHIGVMFHVESSLIQDGDDGIYIYAVEV